MPQMDGNELVRRAKQLHPGLPAMIVSGTVNAFDRALHADVFLPKGACSPAEMIERIRVLVARKRGPKKAVPHAAHVRTYHASHSQQLLARFSAKAGRHSARTLFPSRRTHLFSIVAEACQASTSPYFRCH